MPDVATICEVFYDSDVSESSFNSWDSETTHCENPEHDTSRPKSKAWRRVYRRSKMDSGKHCNAIISDPDSPKMIWHTMPTPTGEPEVAEANLERFDSDHLSESEQADGEEMVECIGGPSRPGCSLSMKPRMRIRKR